MNDDEIKDYVSFFREDENVYYLNGEGRKITDSLISRKKTSHVKHFIMRNQVFIHYKCPLDWENEVELAHKESGIRVFSDATFTENGRKHIVEVDNTQKMIVNINKMKKYMVLKKYYRLPPKFIWVTTTDRKKQKLEKLCKEHGLAHTVYTYREIYELNN